MKVLLLQDLIEFLFNMKLKLLVGTISILVASYITGVGVATNSFTGVGWATLTAIVLALINLTIKPIISFITLPVTIVTLGLFSFVINGAMILLASQMVAGFNIPSFLMAIYFSLILSIINWVLHIFS